MDRYDWIIGICNTGADGVVIYRFHASSLHIPEPCGAGAPSRDYSAS